MSHSALGLKGSDFGSVHGSNLFFNSLEVSQLPRAENVIVLVGKRCIKRKISKKDVLTCLINTEDYHGNADLSCVKKKHVKASVTKPD